MRAVICDLLPTVCLVVATCLTQTGATGREQPKPSRPDTTSSPPSATEVLTIGAAVQRCVETGLQYEPAFMRGASLELVWRSDRLARLSELTFKENGYEDLWVSSEQSFTTCVRDRLERARILWPPRGRQRVCVQPAT